MSRSTHARRSLGATVVALLLVGLLLAGCGDDGDGATTEPTTTAASTTSTEADGAGGGGDATTAAPTTTEDPGKRIEVTVADGEVTGGGRIRVDKDQPVTLIVTSDADDEVHVHGFDVTVALVAGEPAELAFTPDASGVYEVELHEAGTLLFELEVR